MARTPRYRSEKGHPVTTAIAPYIKRLAEIGDGDPVAKRLGQLIRPMFTAAENRTLVWGDWANIEARVLPWLANSSGGERRLDVFRESDADPTKPDSYIVTAAGMRGEDPAELWARYLAKDKEAKKARQAQGKVPDLSLGFGGGVGALENMAVNYGVYLDEETARWTVRTWRETNAWAPDFWGAHGRNGSSGLWGAACSALENPDTPFVAGRLTYVFDPRYMEGTLFCVLPCGRPLAYPKARWEWRSVEDKKTGEVTDKFQLTYLKAYGRAALWYGKLAENATQAVAASILRRTLRRLETRPYAFMPTVMHTHDEIVTSPLENSADMAARELKLVMETNGEWDIGLPLKAEVKTNWYYTKAEE